MNKDQKPIDIQTFSCPDSTCRSRPFKRKSHLLVHLREVHDCKSQHGQEPGDSIKKLRTSGQEHRFDFCTGHDQKHVSSIKEDKGILRGAQKVDENPLGLISLMNLETVDLADWNHDFGEPFTDMNPVCFEEPSISFPYGNPLNLGVEDLQDGFLGWQPLDEGAKMKDLPSESDDQTKYKMVSAIQDKYAELRRIDEQISTLEKLKASRSNVSQDIAGLEGNYRELIGGVRYGL